MRSRFVFFAGLGGTGHHFWQALLRECPLCSDAPDVRHALHSWWYASHRETSDAPQKNVSELLANHAKARDDTLWCLNVLNGDGTGMMSYPNGGSRWNMPHIDWLETAARLANVSLTVVLLLRDAVAVEASIDRRFHAAFAHRWTGVDPVAAAMTVQAYALQFQLREVRNLVCIRYEVLPNLPSTLDSLLPAPDTNSHGWSFSSAASRLFRVETGNHSKAAAVPQHLQSFHTASLALDEACTYFSYPGRSRHP